MAKSGNFLSRLINKIVGPPQPPARQPIYKEASAKKPQKSFLQRVFGTGQQELASAKNGPKKSFWQRVQSKLAPPKPVREEKSLAERMGIPPTIQWTPSPPASTEIGVDNYYHVSDLPTNWTRAEKDLYIHLMGGDPDLILDRQAQMFMQTAFYSGLRGDDYANAHRAFDDYLLQEYDIDLDDDMDWVSFRHQYKSSEQ